MRKTKKIVVALAAITALAACSTTPSAEEPADDLSAQGEDASPEEVVEEEITEEEPAADGSSRGNPAPLGTVIADGDWEVVVTNVNLDATDQIMSDNEFNDPPGDGNIYIMVEATVTYHGSDPQGAIPFAAIDYVTADGSTINIAWVAYELPDFTMLDPLYEGASHTGWNAYEVPAPVDGVLAVSADMFSDKVFIAIQ